MDTYLLKAAVLYALSATSRTSSAVDDFLQIASFASPDLDPLAYELFDLRAPLERLADSESAIPRQLQHPILAIVRASGDSLSRIDTLLQDCTDESSCEIRWNAVRPKVQELKAGLCTCRRTLQLSLEVVTLAAARDDGTDMDMLATYLDQDTSRVLALIRRTLQYVQDEDQTDDLYRGLRSSLDEIRLLVQDMCKHKDETKLTALQMAASGGSSNVQSHTHEASTLVSEPQEVSLHEEIPESEAPVPLISGLRPAKKLSSAFAKWSLAGASRKSKFSSVSSTSNSVAEISTAEDGISNIDISVVPTIAAARQPSHRSESSCASSYSSRGDVSKDVVRPANAPQFEILPPTLPPRNPRRSTLISIEAFDRIQGALLPSPPTPSFDMPDFSAPSVTESLRSHNSERSPVRVPLPLFAISPSEKIIINPADIPAHWNRHGPKVVSPEVRLSQTHLISFSLSKFENAEGGHASTVFFVDISPASYLLASKYGDKTIKIHGLPQGNLQASLKVNFYIQMQDRTRDFFVTSHAILSETRSLLAVAARFGDTLEIWNWALNKRIQTLDSVNRWAVAKNDIYETRFSPLVCYREIEDALYLYPMADAAIMRRQDVIWGPSPNSKQKPFGKPMVISLRDAGLPLLPKLPELAYSSTAPLLVAAAGPRSARPGHAPPEHAAMLMAWDLSGRGRIQCPSYFCMPAHHSELDTALPCGLAVHGNTAVSIWIPHNVRVIGSPGAWQVEPVMVPNRFVLVWNMSENTTSLFSIPHEDTVACISPDCRYVAYRQGTGRATRDGSSSLAILDALDAGRELWRTPVPHEEVHDEFLNPARISCLSFSSDGGKFIVGDVRGLIGVYEVIPVKSGRVNILAK